MKKKRKNKSKKLIPIFVIILLGISVVARLAVRSNIRSVQNKTTPTQKENMLLISSSFENNLSIPSKFTCDGGNINPELQIQNTPEDAKSLALIMDDPDAPIGTFTHWLAWNIDPKTEIIKQESKPPGSVEGKNSSGSFGYMGPCPPSGEHHYHFKLYALNSMLNISADSSKQVLEQEIQKYLITETELIGLYKRR